MALFSFLKRSRTFAVKGPQGGLSTHIVLPEGFDPAKDRCPMVILMHGFMARKSMYPITALAKALKRQGIASISFDFDAHGQSEGKFIDMTLSNEVADARAVFDYVRQLPYVNGIALAGHSQGGVIAGILAGELETEGLKPACLVQLAPAAVLKDDAIKGQCMNARYDPVNPPEYVSVFFHKLGRKFILEAQKYPIYQVSAQFTGKVCLIHGGKDKIVPLSYSQHYNEVYAESSLHILEKEGHFLGGDRKTVIGIAVSFLKDNLPG